MAIEMSGVNEIRQSKLLQRRRSSVSDLLLQGLRQDSARSKRDRAICFPVARLLTMPTRSCTAKLKHPRGKMFRPEN
ncbi:MAG TPA: hypothetical protein VMR62_32445 [Bryobacteraceae bacterium]|jgi:hypothetical protein|nr:hypothetical protein [Bryobacteraceae bacterium]